MLDFDTAKATLLDLAKERPDYIHPTDPKVEQTSDDRAERGQPPASCYYRFSDGSPGCLIGAMVDKLYPDVRLRELSSAEPSLRHANIPMTARTAFLLNRAQSQQDNGDTWYYAVQDAIAETEEKFPNGDL